jgi:uncharacterized membrane protein
MGLATALLVLASALIHATWNAILKRTREPEKAVVGVVVASAASAFGVWAVTRAPFPPPASVAWCLASGVLEAFYFVTLARALARAPLGPVYTVVRGGALVVVWPVSILALGERLTLPALGGTVLILLGLASTGAAEMPRRDESPLVRRLGWAVVCAGFVGSYQMAYKMALTTGGHPGAVVAVSLGSACVCNLAVLGRARARGALDALRAQPALVLGAGTLTSVGFAVFLVAMTRAGAGAVVTLRNTSILFAQAIALGLGDRPKRLGVIGAVLVTGGAVLLAR